MFQNLSFKQSKALSLLFALFVIFLIWRIALFTIPPSPEGELNLWSFAWGASYQIIAIFGAVAGIIVARSWGGWKSLLGKVILAFAIGLLFQCLGQTISSYYVYTLGDIPYPSLGDIGFFGSVLFYIYGIIILGRVSGVRVSIKSFATKIQAVVIPLAALVLSYLIFLQGYELDWTHPIKIVLDFGYPLGQAFYISIAILVYLLSRKMLGGIMKWPIFFFIIALALQYISDFTFLYQATRGLYIPEGINDLMYFVSYFVMAVSLLQLRTVFAKIRNA